MNLAQTPTLPVLDSSICKQLRLPADITENLMVHYLQAHDARSLSYLYDAYSPALYGAILRIVKNEIIAEDVLQECFIKIWKNYHLYDSSKGRLFTWLVNIARHLAIDKLRSHDYLKKLKTSSIDADSPAGWLESSGFLPEHIGIRELTSKLSHHHKKIIDLMYFEGLSQSEIAHKLNIPLGTVKTRARKAIQLLQKIIR